MINYASGGKESFAGKRVAPEGVHAHDAPGLRDELHGADRTVVDLVVVD